MPRTPTPAAPPVTWVEADLGDTEFTVQEHSDGFFTIDLPDDRLVLNADAIKPIVEGFIRLGRERGWV